MYGLKRGQIGLAKLGIGVYHSEVPGMNWETMFLRFEFEG